MRTRFLAAFLFAAAFAATAAAQQTRVSGTLRCKPDPATPMAVGDKPNHALVVGKAQCTWPKPIEMAGVLDKDGVSTATDEIDGDKSSTRGYHVGTLANGDKYVTRFHGTAKLKDGKPVTATGTWTFVSGTGKVKGIQGKGIFNGTANPDGSMTYAIEGQYKIPESARGARP